VATTCNWPPASNWIIAGRRRRRPDTPIDGDEPYSVAKDSRAPSPAAFERFNSSNCCLCGIADGYAIHDFG